MNKIIYADALAGLKSLPDKLVDMCVTSPPYFNLRDYQTGTWEGGDANCTHKIPEGECDPKRAGKDIGSSHVARFNREKCFKCGAIRVDKQIGLEKSPNEFIQKLVDVFREVKRVLKDDGTIWINIGDSYNGYKGNANSMHGGSPYAGFRDQPTCESNYGLEDKNLKPKDLMGIPWRLAFALQADGWYLRQDIIWAKPSPMPESVTDRFTKSHEYIFLLSKQQKYYFDYKAVREPCSPASVKDFLRRSNTEVPVNTNEEGYLNARPDLIRSRADYMPEDFMRNKRDVFTVGTKPTSNNHYAGYPPDLIRPCILAGSRKGGIVLDPFIGSGTTAEVAIQEGREVIGIDLNPDYCKMAEKRMKEAIGEKWRELY